MITNLTWRCHVCGEERPDDKISVFKKKIKIGNAEGQQNVRYCNDRPGCTKGAEKVDFLNPAVARA